MSASIRVRIKKVAESIPPFVGIRLSSLSYKYRLGSDYVRYKELASKDVKKQYIFQSMREIVRFSEKNIPFYSRHYRINRFSSNELISYDDIKKIPIVNKSDLQNCEFGDRTALGGIDSNTGGTSGNPLKIKLDSGSYAREWAHMHQIWARLDYTSNKIKLTFRGMNLGSTPVRYNFVHNEFQVNAYCEFESIVEWLKKNIGRYKFEYIHGYPSGIYEFFRRLSDNNRNLIERLKIDLKGVFFGSEYPAEIYREYIEYTLAVPTISWYGHSEMAVLAPESRRYVYSPMQSYGYAECVDMNDGQHLIGTTYHNYLGPLIRYDTGDLIRPLNFVDGVLAEFEIAEGRVGDFVVDNYGRRISLTALVFGRHHKLFDVADFVQVCQPDRGKLIVLISSTKRSVNYEELFDSGGIAMDFLFKVIPSPIKSRSGKVGLLVDIKKVFS